MIEAIRRRSSRARAGRSLSACASSRTPGRRSTRRFPNRNRSRAPRIGAGLLSHPLCRRTNNNRSGIQAGNNNRSEQSPLQSPPARNGRPGGKQPGRRAIAAITSRNWARAIQVGARRVLKSGFASRTVVAQGVESSTRFRRDNFCGRACALARRGPQDLIWRGALKPARIEG